MTVLSTHGTRKSTLRVRAGGRGGGVKKTNSITTPNCLDLQRTPKRKKI